MSDIGTLPGYAKTSALAVNNLGQVVGFAWAPDSELPPVCRAFLYDHTDGSMVDINSLIPAGSPWYLSKALGINEAGQIIVRAEINGEVHAVLLTPIN